MELLSVFFALAAIVLLYFSNRLYVKKSVIGYRTHMAYYQEANSMSYCGMIGLYCLSRHGLVFPCLPLLPQYFICLFSKR